MMADLQSQLEIIKRGAVDVLPEEELVAKLKRGPAAARQSGLRSDRAGFASGPYCVDPENETVPGARVMKSFF